MAVHAGEKIIEKYRTGSFEWNFTDTDELLTGSSYGFSFEFCGFDCSLYTRRYVFDDIYHTMFYIQDTTFPKWFSSSYTMTLIDGTGNEYYTVKGSIQPRAKNVLMTVTDNQRCTEKLCSLLRISWFKAENCATSKQGVPVEPENIAVNDQSVQTEKPKYPPTKDKCTSTEKDDTTLLETLSKDLGYFYERKADTDCVLRVGQTQFPVHRQVLAARSTVFEAMFHHNTSESLSGTVDIPDVEADAMNDVLFYVYTGIIRSLTADSAIPMYVVADKYALMELKDKCMDFLLYNLTLGNFCDAAVLAHTHGETELENKVVLFIEERLKELMDNENWKLFLKNKPVLASGLLCSALMANKEKMEKMSSKE